MERIMEIDKLNPEDLIMLVSCGVSFIGLLLINCGWLLWHHTSHNERIVYGLGVVGGNLFVGGLMMLGIYSLAEGQLIENIWLGVTIAILAAIFAGSSLGILAVAHTDN